jgi:hypothetical protein
MTNRTAPRDYELTCWYLNLRRAGKLIGIDTLTPHLRALGSITDAQGLQRTATLSFFERRLENWLAANNPRTLGQLILRNELDTNQLFTHYSNYYFKGLSKVREAIYRRKPVIPMAEGYAKLDEFREGLRIDFQFHHEHLTSDSSWVELSGQKTVLVLGIIDDATETEISATPIAIAYPFIGILDPDRPSVIGERWPSRLETFTDQIDSFRRIREFDRPRALRDLEVLRNVPEAAVKNAFAEIIGEPTVPKDWGGERSDLFTSWVEIRGERVSTAIAFKGPAKFRPMTQADLGKNGDQIDRLFSEPADLMILQHCHEITPPVRSMMRAYAQQIGQLKTFCLIDGYDTLRILGAYDKCGIKPAGSRHAPGLA